MDSPERPVSWSHVLVTTIIVAGCYFAFRQLVRAGALDPALAKLVLWIPIPLAAAALLRRQGGALAGIGLRPPFLMALAPAAAAIIVETGIFLAYGFKAALPALDTIVSGVLVAAVTEEILFRGYAVNQLRAAGLSARLAVVLGGVLFGAAHLPNLWSTGDAGSIALEAAITGAGGIVFAIVMLLMNGSVIAAIGLHFALNLVWELFAIAPDAIGNREGLIARGAAIAAAIIVALVLGRSARRSNAGDRS